MRELCAKGHEFTQENIFPKPNGRKECRLCRRDRARQYRDGAVLDWRADDVDYVVVERALKGHDTGRPLHPRELREVARSLASQGLGTSALAKLTKCNTGTAQRLMAEVSV